MGFRPAVEVIQRDQYGDRAVLIVGDDSPVEGKVPPGYMMTDLPVDLYGVMGGAPQMAWTTPATLTSSNVLSFVTPVWGGSSGGSGGSKDHTTLRPSGPGHPSIGDDSSEPPIRGTLPWNRPLGPVFRRFSPFQALRLGFC